MTYFGITALGPPNNFQSSLCSALGINVFSNEEFEAVFQRYCKDSKISANDVEDLLHDTFGFPPLEDEVTLFTSRMSGDDGYTWE